MMDNIQCPKDFKYWTVGDNYFYDIIIPEAAISLGCMFGLWKDKEDIFFKDFSDLDFE